MKNFEQSGEQFLQRIKVAATIEGEFYDESAIEALDNVASLFEKSPNVFVAFSHKEIVDFLGDYASRNDLLNEEGEYNFISMISYLGEKTGKDFTFLIPIIENMMKGKGFNMFDLLPLNGLFSHK